MVKRLSTMQKTQVRSLGREEPLEEEMAIHFSTIAWKIPLTEEPGRLQSMGLQRIGHNLLTKQQIHGNKLNFRKLSTFTIWCLLRVGEEETEEERERSFY